MGVIWSFRYYVEDDGTSDVRAAYDAGSVKLQAKFEEVVDALALLSIQEWGRPYYRDLRRDGKGIGELRFKADNVQQRPLGFRSDTSEFTLVFWATEKEDNFVPAKAVKIALARKAEIISGKAKTNVLWTVEE